MSVSLFSGESSAFKPPLLKKQQAEKAPIDTGKALAEKVTTLTVSSNSAFKVVKKESGPSSKQPPRPIRVINTQKGFLSLPLEKSKALAAAYILRTDIVHRCEKNILQVRTDEARSTHARFTRLSTPKKVTAGLGHLMFTMKESHSISTFCANPEDPDKTSLKLVYNKVLGQGSQGTVRQGLVVNPENQASHVAFKMNTSGNIIGNKALTNEAERLMKLSEHPSIPAFWFCFSYNSVLNRPHTIMCMELFQANDMYSSVLQQDISYSLPLTTIFSIKMLSALEHLKKNNTLHLDLKPENIIYIADNPGEEEPEDRVLSPLEFQRLFDSTTLKIIDFGCSMDFGERSDVSYIQTRWNRSPLIFLSNRLNETLDLFSVGTILYEMFAGRPLFSYSHEIISYYPIEFQRGESEEARQMRNLAHLYTLKAILNQPSNATLARLPQDKVANFYKIENGQYILKPLPILSPKFNQKIKSKLEKEKEVVLEAVQSAAESKNCPKQQIDNFVDFVFQRLLNVNEPPVLEELFDHPFITFYGHRSEV